MPLRKGTGSGLGMAGGSDRIRQLLSETRNTQLEMARWAVSTTMDVIELGEPAGLLSALAVGSSVKDWDALMVRLRAIRANVNG